MEKQLTRFTIHILMLEDALSILGIYPGEENPEENSMIPRISIFAPVYLLIERVELYENLFSIWLTGSDMIEISA